MPNPIVPKPNIGDVVVLRSGGPAMTVSIVWPLNSTCEAEWFVGGQRNQAPFHDNELFLLFERFPGKKDN